MRSIYLSKNMLRYVLCLLTALSVMAFVIPVNAAMPGGPCPKYNTEDGKCKGSHPRHCKVHGKPGFCHSVKDKATNSKECRCLKIREAVVDETGHEVMTFDPAQQGDISIDMSEGEAAAEAEQRGTCVGFQFRHQWYPKACEKAAFWGGCSLIAWRYPAGDYTKPDGSVLKWPGGSSPFSPKCN